MAVSFKGAGVLVVAGTGTTNAPNAPATVDANDLLMEFLSVVSNVTQTPSTGFTGKTQENGTTQGSLFMAWKKAAGTEDGASCSMATGASLAANSGFVMSLAGAHVNSDPVAQYTTSLSAGAVTTVPSASLSSIVGTSYVLWVATFQSARTLSAGPSGFTRLTNDVSSNIHVFGKASPSSSESTSGVTFTTSTNVRVAMYEIKVPAANADGNAVRSGVRAPIVASVIRSGVRQPATVSVIRSGVRVPVV